MLIYWQKVEINISIGIYQITTYNEVFADIHDIELTGGIETSIRGAREQLTISRKM
jgi:hypothetical protein